MRDLNDIMKDFSDKLTDKSEPNGVQKILNAREVLNKEWQNASTDGDKKALLAGYTRLFELTEKAVNEYADSYASHQGTGHVTENSNKTIKLQIQDDEAFKRLVAISCNLAENCNKAGLEFKEPDSQATALLGSGNVLRSVAKYAEQKPQYYSLQTTDKKGNISEIDKTALGAVDRIAMAQLKAATNDGQRGYILAEASKAIKEATKNHEINISPRPLILDFAEAASQKTGTALAKIAERWIKNDPLNEIIDPSLYGSKSIAQPAPQNGFEQAVDQVAAFVKGMVNGGRNP